MRIGITLLILLILTSTASAGVPDLWGNSTVEFVSYTGTEPLVLRVHIDGSGPPLTEAGDGIGTVDASIRIVLRDWGDVPIAHYPAEDLWLEAADGGLAICPGGTTADQNTDVNGETFFVQPLLAGGFSQAGTWVMGNGDPYPEIFPLYFNSPDLNGNLDSDLADLASFSFDYFAGYAFRSDLAYDGVVNLVDLSKFVQSWGDQGCP